MGKIIFGSSGNDEDFYLEHTSSAEAPAYLAKKNVFGYEYGFTHGIHSNQLNAYLELADECNKNDISLSIHAQFFINFASDEDIKVENSINYLLQSYDYGVCKMGAERIVFHPAALGKHSRKEALEIAKANLTEFANRFAKYRQSHNGRSAYFCIETMGKHGQLGTVDEVLELCAISDIFMPCIDFGHINSFEGGSLKSVQDYVSIIEKIKSTFSDERSNNLHIHFSKIKYGPKGELSHLKFSDDGEPDYKQMIDALIQTGVNATVICESRGSQMKDAEIMCEYYNNKVSSVDV